MDNQTLDAADAVPINGVWLIPIKADCERLFGTNKVKFQIYIKDNKIIIESPKILEDTDNQDKHRIKEVIVIG